MSGLLLIVLKCSVDQKMFSAADTWIEFNILLLTTKTILMRRIIRAAYVLGSSVGPMLCGLHLALNLGRKATLYQIGRS